MPAREDYDMRSDAEDVRERKREKKIKELKGRGITVRQLLKFYEHFQQDGELTSTTTTEEVVSKIILPQTASSGVSYMKSDFMRGLGVKCSPATRFVSHAWGAPFVSTVASIVLDAAEWTHCTLAREAFHSQAHESHHKGATELLTKELVQRLDRATLGKSYWLDVFAINHHLTACKKWGCKCSTIRSIGENDRREEADKTFYVLERMDSLVVSVDATLRSLERLWVLVEIGWAATSKKDGGITRSQPVHLYVPFGIDPRIRSSMKDRLDDWRNTKKENQSPSPLVLCPDPTKWKASAETNVKKLWDRIGTLPGREQSLWRLIQCLVGLRFGCWELPEQAFTSYKLKEPPHDIAVLPNGAVVTKAVYGGNAHDGRDVTAQARTLLKQGDAVCVSEFGSQYDIGGSLKKIFVTVHKEPPDLLPRTIIRPFGCDTRDGYCEDVESVERWWDFYFRISNLLVLYAPCICSLWRRLLSTGQEKTYTLEHPIEVISGKKSMLVMQETVTLPLSAKIAKAKYDTGENVTGLARRQLEQGNILDDYSLHEHGKELMVDVELILNLGVWETPQKLEPYTPAERARNVLGKLPCIEIDYSWASDSLEELGDASEAFTLGTVKKPEEVERPSIFSEHTPFTGLTEASQTPCRETPCEGEAVSVQQFSQALGAAGELADSVGGAVQEFSNAVQGLGFTFGDILCDAVGIGVPDNVSLKPRRLEVSFRGCRKLESLGSKRKQRELMERLETAKAKGQTTFEMRKAAFDSGNQLAALLTEQKDLHALSLSFFHCHNLGSDAFEEVVGSLDELNSLRELHLDLQCFKACDEASSILALSHYFDHMPVSLKKLRLEFQPVRNHESPVDDTLLISLAHGMPGSLEELSLSFKHCSGIGDTGLVAISDALPSSVKKLHITLRWTACLSEFTSRKQLKNWRLGQRREPRRVWPNKPEVFKWQELVHRPFTSAVKLHRRCLRIFERNMAAQSAQTKKTKKHITASRRLVMAYIPLWFVLLPLILPCSYWICWMYVLPPMVRDWDAKAEKWLRHEGCLGEGGSSWNWYKALALICSPVVLTVVWLLAPLVITIFEAVNDAQHLMRKWEFKKYHPLVPQKTGSKPVTTWRRCSSAVRFCCCHCRPRGAGSSGEPRFDSVGPADAKEAAPIAEEGSVTEKGKHTLVAHADEENVLRSADDAREVPSEGVARVPCSSGGGGRDAPTTATQGRSMAEAPWRSGVCPPTTASPSTGLIAAGVRAAEAPEAPRGEASWRSGSCPPISAAAPAVLLASPTAAGGRAAEAAVATLSEAPWRSGVCPPTTASPSMGLTAAGGRAAEALDAPRGETPWRSGSCPPISAAAPAGLLAGPTAAGERAAEAAVATLREGETEPVAALREVTLQLEQLELATDSPQKNFWAPLSSSLQTLWTSWMPQREGQDTATDVRTESIDIDQRSSVQTRSCEFSTADVLRRMSLW